MVSCRICRSSLTPFLSLGQQPLANHFLKPQEFEAEYFYPLEIMFCPFCKMVQIMEQPPADLMYHEEYAFYSGTSSHMRRHFEDFAAQVKGQYLTGPDAFVLELGCNDGILLQNFLDPGIRHLGVEPSGNVARAARERGLIVWNEFFSPDLVPKIIRDFGQADAVVGANVLNHMPELDTVFQSLEKLLKPDAVAIFEDPYLHDVMRLGAYDQFYDEHVFLFSLQSMDFVSKKFGFEVVAADHQETHGGSMRYTLCRKGQRSVHPDVKHWREREIELKYDRLESYQSFAKTCESSRDALLALLKQLKSQGKRVVAYAATAKGTTVSNFCGIGPELIPCLYDSTPLKQGKFSPGSHIPVLDAVGFKDDPAEYALLLAPNHAREIFAKEKSFAQRGGRWILHVPRVHVLEDGKEIT